MSVQTNIRQISRASKVGNTAVGLLFLTAAVLKLHALSKVPFVGPFELVFTTWDLILIGVESVVAYGLTTNRVPVSSRRIAATMLGCFVVISAYKWLSGYRTCSCFGLLEVSPAVSLILSLACLAVMMVTSSMPLTYSARPELGWPQFAAVSLAVIAGATFVSAAIPRAGATVARITAIPVFTEWVSPPPTPNSLETNEKILAKLRIHNFSSSAFSLVGGRGAGCDVTTDLPVRVPAGEFRDITVVFTGVGNHDRVLSQFELQSTELGAYHSRLQLLNVKDLRGFLFAMAKL